MSDRAGLHPVVLSKFREAFGEPHTSVKADSHWALRRLPYMAAVNVRINGAKEEPIVWVFDPHSPKDGVSHTRINSEADIDNLIKRIVAIVAAGGDHKPGRS
jgi:hypothetical protein